MCVVLTDIMKQWCCLLDACVCTQRKLLFSTAETSGRFAIWLQNFPAALNAVGKISIKHIGNLVCLGSRETTTSLCVQQTCHLLGNTTIAFCVRSCRISRMNVCFSHFCIGKCSNKWALLGKYRWTSSDIEIVSFVKIALRPSTFSHLLCCKISFG